MVSSLVTHMKHVHGSTRANPLYILGVIHVPKICLRCCYIMVYIPAICLWCCKLLHVLWSYMRYIFSIVIYVQKYINKNIGAWGVLTNTLFKFD